MREPVREPMYEERLPAHVVWLAFATPASVQAGQAAPAPFAGDDTYLVGGQSDGVMAVLTMDGPRVRDVQRFATGTKSLYQFAVHPHGTMVATAGQGEVELWELPRGTRLETFPFEKGERLQAIAFSTGGDTLLLASNQEVVRAVELASGRVMQRFRGGERNPSIACHPDGHAFVHLACFQGGSAISVSELAGGRATAEGDHTEDRISTTYDALNPGSFSPDGHLYACSDRHVKLYRYPSFELVHAFDLLGSRDAAPREGLNIEQGWSNTVFGPDGRILMAGSPLGTLFLWDVESGAIQSQWPAHRGGVIAMASSRTGALIASAGQDRTMKLWNLASR